MLKEYFKDWNAWDYCWTIIASVVGTWIGLQWGSWLSVITMLSGLWCVILVAKGRILNYYVGIVNCVGYAYIAYGYQLYGEVMLNALYFLPMQFVGLYIWSRNKDVKIMDKVKTTVMTPQIRLTWLGVSVAAIVLYGFMLQAMGDPVPFLDSTSTILSIIACILMTWRYVEQWILWIVVDIVSVWMWIVVVLKEGTNDIALLVMWIAFLINAIYGFYSWIKMYKEQEEL